MVLSHSLGCMGQNVYNSSTVYYNMDTLRCVDNNVQFWERFNAGNIDSAGWYCTFKKYIDLPVLKVNDDFIFHLIDSSLNEVPEWDDLQFPDSSGYYIEISIYEKRDDSSMLVLSVSPSSNYYMSNFVINPHEEVVYEWFGIRLHNFEGCFYYNNILCIVESDGRLDYENKASCLFANTQSSIRIELYSPVLQIVQEGSYVAPRFWDYFFHKCDL